jgi:hypothetical protein
MPYPKRIRVIANIIEAGFEKAAGREQLIEQVTDADFWADFYEWDRHGLDIPDEHEARMAVSCLVRSGRLVAGPYNQLHHPVIYPNTSAEAKRAMKPRRRKRRA